MKNVLLTLVLVSPFVCLGQSVFGIEGYRNGVDLLDKRLDFLGNEGYSAGIWYEQMFGEVDGLGIKANISYTQRRAQFDEVDLKNDVVVLGVMARIHDRDPSVPWLGVVGGLGLYGQFPKSDDLFETMDMGMTVEVGLDFKYLVLTGYIQNSFLDVTQLPKWQRWVSFGIGLQVPVWRGKKATISE